MASKWLCQDVKDNGNSPHTSSGFPAGGLGLLDIANNYVSAVAIYSDAIANNIDFRHLNLTCPTKEV